MPIQPKTQSGASRRRDLDPQVSDAEVTDAQNRFDRYLELAVRIFERLSADPTYPENLPALTAKRGDLTMNLDSVDQMENRK